MLCILCTSLFPLQNWLSKWIRSARFKPFERRTHAVEGLKLETSDLNHFTDAQLQRRPCWVFKFHSLLHHRRITQISLPSLYHYVELNNQWLAEEKIISLNEKLPKDTFRLMKVNTAPSNPPMIPRITVGMKARMFKPMPWLIWNIVYTGLPPQKVGV